MILKTRICGLLSALILMLIPACKIYAQNSSTHLGLKTVVIDPGHGGKDPGALGKSKNMHEKHVVLAVSKLLGAKIKEAYPDVKVIYTRNNDTFLGLHERAMVARRNNADLFISIHCNGSENSEAKGSSVHILGQSSKKNKNNQTDYFERNMSVAQRENSVIVLEEDYQTKYQTFDPDSPESYISHQLQWMAYYESSLLFASEVVDNLIVAPLTPRRIVIDQDIFQVLVEANMPAVLLELAFVTNPTEYKYLSSEAGQKAIAERLFKAFKSYKTKFDASVNVVESVKPKPASEPEPKAEPKPKSEPKPEADIPATVKTEQPVADSYYAIQVMGLKRNAPVDDPAFKGLKMTVIPPGEGSVLYRYVTATGDKAHARSQLENVQKKFPHAYLVKVTGTKVVMVK